MKYRTLFSDVKERHAERKNKIIKEEKKKLFVKKSDKKDKTRKSLFESAEKLLGNIK